MEPNLKYHVPSLNGRGLKLEIAIFRYNRPQSQENISVTEQSFENRR
jgi:hypothetical protein